MRNPDRETVFRFKQFSVTNRLSAMRVGTDGVLLGAWSFRYLENSGEAMSCMDIGCGTGLLSLMLAQRFSNAQITGIEIDTDATEEAQENFSQSPWAERLTCQCSDFLELGWEIFPDATFDLIISNPPFFLNGVIAEGSRGVARHSDSLPADQLFARSSRLLKPQGRIAIIAPYEQADQLIVTAEESGLRPMRRTDVRHNPSRPIIRSMIEFMKGTPEEGCIHETLSLHDSENKPTEEYRALVEDFYLRIH